jgi:hypothetical protein
MNLHLILVLEPIQSNYNPLKDVSSVLLGLHNPFPYRASSVFLRFFENILIFCLVSCEASDL